MNRTFLRLFYVFVQFVMLAVSIPKVAALFHAYDAQTMGPLVAGLDIRSWAVGNVIDLCAVFTTWAAMAKYDESRKRSALIAPAVIILFCSALSVVANYEDAATQHPEQYANVSLFTHPALLVNPILISAPPILVLLLILLVPSVLAQPRIKSAAEIEAEADEQEARIKADARVRQAKAQANIQVMSARLKGVVETVQAVTAKTDDPSGDITEIAAEPQPEPPDDPPATTKMTRAMWQAMKLSERVQRSGVITQPEIAEVLGISVSHARNLYREVPNGAQSVDGRKGVSYTDLIESLYNTRSEAGVNRAKRLEMALGVRKRSRTAQTATADEVLDAPEVSDELA